MQNLRNLFLPCIFILTASLGLCSQPTYEIIPDSCHLSILSPSLAHRKTEKIRLQNGLCVYLISDPDANQSAAALSLPVGSWDDPKQYPGMAHFLEHMLFNGTQKYPQPFEFFQFVSDHGGTPNAFTGSEKTVYSFSINHDGFLDGLDRFSQFFISPLFDPSSIGKELFAVDEEFSKNREQDGWRWYQVSKENANPLHPHVLFSTGNADTLKGIPSDRLKEWYATHYSPHLMKLVVYSPLALDTLREKVAFLFSEVPDRKATTFSFEGPLSTNLQQGHITYIPTIKKGKNLLIQWELPKSLIQDDCQSPFLVCYALTRGHENSLLEELKREQLATDLSFSPQEFGPHHLFLEMEIELTDEGCKNLFLVVERCYQALADLQKNEIPDYLFNEMKIVKQLSYEHQVRQDPFSFVENHASSLLFQPFSTYPEKSYVPQKFDREKVKQVLLSLSPKKGIYYLLAEKDALSAIVFDREEKWMHVPYTMKPLDDHLLESWGTLNPHPQIRLSPPNPFICGDLHYVAKQESQNRAILITKSDHGQVFYHSANEYDEPNVSLSFSFQSPLAKKKDFSTLAGLFLLIADQKNHSTLLQARAAGINASLSLETEGVSLEISGYSEKTPLLIQTLLRSLSALSFTEEDFILAKKSLSERLENFQKELPITQANELVRCLLEPQYISNSEKFSLIQNVTFDQLVTFSQELFAYSYVEGVLLGNLSLQDAESLWLDVEEILSKGGYAKSSHPSKESYSFPQTDGPFVLEKTTNALGTGVILALDAGDFSHQKRAAQQILSQALHEAFFSALRTNQKTGYIVQSWDIEKERHLYHLFGVQSAGHDAKDLLSRFEIFIDSFLQDINKNIPQERFASIQENLVTRLKTPLPNLKEFLFRQKQLAFDYDEDFDWMEKRINGAQDLTYEEFLKYAEAVLSSSNKKRIAIEVNGILDQTQTLQYKNLSLEMLRSKGIYRTR